MQIFLRLSRGLRSHALILASSIPAPYFSPFTQSQRNTWRKLAVGCLRRDTSIAKSLMPGEAVHDHAAEAAAEAAFDLRSDVVTVPTASMLHAVSHATYKDDVHHEDATTEALQSDMAAMTGHEAGLFVLSGTMGNGLALRSLLFQPPYGIIVDASANMLLWEGGHLATLAGAVIQAVEPRHNGKYLTLEDIMDHIILDESVTSSPTRVIALENTVHGMVVPLAEIRRISSFAREHGVKLHLDGARLFDAVVAGGGSLSDYAREFDTVTMCFSKGLGAPVGSMLVGSKSVIKQARKLRQTVGGGLHQAGVLTVMARVALTEIFGGRSDGKGSVLTTCHHNARRIAELWTKSGGKLSRPTETCMVWLDLEAALLSRDELVQMASGHGLKFLNERLVIHHQVTEEAISRCGNLFRAIAARTLEPRSIEHPREPIGFRSHGV